MPHMVTKFIRLGAMLALAALLTTGCFDFALDMNGDAAAAAGARGPMEEGRRDYLGTAASDEDRGLNDESSETTNVPATTDATPLPDEPTDPTENPAESDSTAEPAKDERAGSPSVADPDLYGPTDVPCLSDGVRVSAGGSIQRTLDSVGSDGTVCIGKGRYRLTAALRPKQGATMIFERGAVLDGSRVVTDWAVDGGQWVAKGQTQSFSSSTTPCSENPAACQSEDLFRDGKPLVRVLERSALRSGTFYFDEGADVMYVADDPSGHRMEVPVAERAIDAVGVRGVTVRNATIEKFAKHGIATSDGWLVANNEIRYVHSHGIRAHGDTQVRGNYIHHTGQMGIFGLGENLVFEGNHLAYNNYLNFDHYHAGATKIVKSSGTVVRNNWSHHNNGDGWWFDTDNIDTLVEGNLFEHNTRFGLFYETSFEAQVTNNVFLSNGDTDDDHGAGLWINTSKDVEIGRNAFEDNGGRTLAIAMTDRGTSDRYGRRETTGMHVHNNTFRMKQGYVGSPYGKPEMYAASSNNRFSDNRYIVPDTTATWWRWGKPDRDGTMVLNWAEWTAIGYDTDGAVTSQ